MKIEHIIKPLKAIGNIRIGGKITQNQKLLKIDSFSHSIVLYGGKTINTCFFDLKKDGVEVHFEIFTQKIIRIETKQNFKGNILNTSIGIGILVKDLLNYYPNNWDSDGYYLWNVNFPGLYFGFLEQDQEFIFEELKNYLNYKIRVIGMIAPNDEGDYDIYGEEWFKKKSMLEKKWNGLE